jgi:DNA ligase (NAD+)
MNKEQIIEWNKAYRQGNPIVSDEEYDLALEELKTTLGWFEYEDFIVTLTEGTDDTGTVKLAYVIGSLAKIKADKPEQLDKFITKNSITELFISEKLDGASMVTVYKDGELVMCSSRGNGSEGTDWTDKAHHFMPNSIPYKGTLELRGEVTLTNDDHIKL